MVWWEQRENRALPTGATTAAPPRRRRRCGVSGWEGTIVGNVLRTRADPQELRATEGREDVHAPAQGRGAIDSGGHTVEGICRDAGPLEGGLGRLERL